MPLRRNAADEFPKTVYNRVNGEMKTVYTQDEMDKLGSPQDWGDYEHRGYPKFIYHPEGKGKVVVKDIEERRQPKYDGWIETPVYREVEPEFIDPALQAEAEDILRQSRKALEDSQRRVDDVAAENRGLKDEVSELRRQLEAMQRPASKPEPVVERRPEPVAERPAPPLPTPPKRP